MAGINKVILVGNLGADVELKYTNEGKAVTSLSIATSESWKDKATGEKVEKTEWHRVSIFGKLAEIAGQYLHKGSKVYVEGQLRTRKWQDKNNQDRYTTEVIVSGFNSTLQMLDRFDSNAQKPTEQTQPKQPAEETTDPIDPVDNSDFDDDIPF